MGADEEHDASPALDTIYSCTLQTNTHTQGASVKEILIEACRRNNTDLLTECLEDKSDPEITKLLNETTTVMGNHLYHEAASRGNCAFLFPIIIRDQEKNTYMI